MRFYALRKSINRDLEDFDEYSFLLEAALNKKYKALLNDIEKQKQSHTEYDEQEIIDFYIDDLNQIGAIFPSFFRKSLIISLYSLLEHEVVRLCQKIEYSLIEKQKYDSGNGNYVNKARKYIESACNIQSKELSNLWNKINTIRITRNILIHGGSRVYHDSKKYRQIESLISNDSKENFIEVTNSGYMFLQKEFVEYFSKILNRLFELIFEEIAQRKRLFES